MNDEKGDIGQPGAGAPCQEEHEESGMGGKASEGDSLHGNNGQKPSGCSWGKARGGR